MTPEARRIVAIEAHRRRTGRCPTRLHSLGTGETFDVVPTSSGFRDLASGLDAHVSGTELRLSHGGGRIDLDLIGDIAFSGYDHTAREPFTGRAGGGASVTVYDSRNIDYFQYAIDDAQAMP